MRTQTADAGTADAFDLPLTTALTEPPAKGFALAANPVPEWPDVLREQIAAVGLGLRREGLFAAACVILGTVAIVSTDFIYGPVNFPLTPKVGIAPALMALFLPMSVWKDEEPSRRGYHHAMPVDHAAHAAARAAAGLVWMLAALVAFFGWMGLLALVTGGPVDHAAPWQWLAPFVAASVTYLLGSAVTLVASRPWRWVGGGLVGYVFLHAFTGIGVYGLSGPVDALDAVFTGRYGFFTLLFGTISYTADVLPAQHLPAWLVSVLIWLTVAVGAFAAAHRQPEA